MVVLSIQPARGKQQAATLAKQIAQFAGSRRGAAAAAVILLAGGGYAYIQEQKQKARPRYRQCWSRKRATHAGHGRCTKEHTWLRWMQTLHRCLQSQER